MNFTPEQLMIGKRLRDLSASWIRNLRDSLQMFSTLPRNHRSFPLPSDFPFSSTALQEKIHWIEEVEGKAIPYKFKVHFEYHLDTTNNWAPAIWILRSSGTPLHIFSSHVQQFDACRASDVNPWQGRG